MKEMVTTRGTQIPPAKPGRDNAFVTHQGGVVEIAGPKRDIVQHIRRPDIAPTVITHPTERITMSQVNRGLAPKPNPIQTPTRQPVATKAPEPEVKKKRGGKRAGAGRPKG